MERDEIEQTLEAWSTSPVPPADPIALDRIESRWRSAAGLSHTHAHGNVLAYRPRRRGALVSAAGLVAAAASLALIVSFRHHDEGQVVGSEAEDVVIVLPGGEVVDPQPGEKLPDGAFVQAGPYAAGRIGGSTISPDDIFKVVNGQLQLSGSVELTESTQAVHHEPGASLPGGGAGGTTGDGDSHTAANPPVTVAEPTSAEPESTATPLPVEPVTEASITQAPVTEAPVTEAPATTRHHRPSTLPIPPDGTVLVVTAQVAGSQVQIDWPTWTGPGFRRYVVFRNSGWNGQGVPKKGRIANILDVGSSQFVDDHPRANTVYVVIVIGAGRQVLAVGSVVSPAADGEVVTVPVETVTG